MKEELLINLESKKNFKKWRNVSIVLFCIILIFIGKLGHSDENKDIILENSIAQIKIDGIIFNDDYRDSKLEEITNNNKIKAVILDIDSPGGVVTPSENVYNLVYKMNKTKPVVVVMDGMATSGAYMVALGSDYLIAKNTTLTGSIGVLLQSYNFVDLAKKVGVDLKTFKSSELKGMPSMFEKNTKNSNLAIQSSVDDIYLYFADLVKTRRNIQKNMLPLAINGQAYTGRQAIKLGLIDEIGDINAALRYLKKKNINTNLPIKKINLRKREKINLLNEFFGKVFFDITSDSNINNKGLLSIYNN